MKKATIVQEINNDWASLDDYIYCNVFDVQEAVDEVNRKIAIDKQIAAGKRAFVQNQFPYQIHTGYHYVLWYAHNQKKTITDALIDEHIQQEILQLLATASSSSLNSTSDSHNHHFDYCWYENPKQSVPSVYHIQVFWVTL